MNGESGLVRILRRAATWDSCLGLLTSVFILVSVFAVPRFATAFNISQAIAGISEKALIVLPMALLMITREIDLSVASILALSSVVLGVLLQDGVGLAPAILLVLLAGTACGLVNGLLVTRLGLSSLLVTLGTMAFYRGLGYVLLGADSVNELPDALTDFGIGSAVVAAVRRPSCRSCCLPRCSCWCCRRRRSAGASTRSAAIRRRRCIRASPSAA